MERLAAIKRAMYEEQRAREVEEANAAAARDAAVAAVVEAERQRMLRDAAARLADFLPKARTGPPCACAVPLRAWLRRGAAAGGRRA